MDWIGLQEEQFHTDSQKCGSTEKKRGCHLAVKKDKAIPGSAIPSDGSDGCEPGALLSVNPSEGSDLGWVTGNPTFF
jgi:hypothetical protein